MPRGEKRWLIACFAASLLGVVLGLVLRALNDRIGLPTGVVIALGVLAGLLFLAGLVAALVLFLREHGTAIFTQDDALACGEWRAVLRAIRRDEAIEPRLREAALRVARRTSARGGWSVYWLLNWCLIGGFNAAVQSGLVRLLWLGLTVLALGAAGYALRHIGRARLAVARFSDQR